MSDDGQVSDLERLTGPGPGLDGDVPLVSAGPAALAITRRDGAVESVTTPPPRRGRRPNASTEQSVKKARKSRAKPAPPGIAARLLRMSLDDTRSKPEAFDLHTIGDRFERIERLATRAIAPLDGLDTESERGYLYFQALLVEALR